MCVILLRYGHFNIYTNIIFEGSGKNVMAIPCNIYPEILSLKGIEKISLPYAREKR